MLGGPGDGVVAAADGVAPLEVARNGAEAAREGHAAQVRALKAQIEAELRSKEGDVKGLGPAQWWAGSGWMGPSLAQEKTPRVQRILRGHFGKVYSMQWGGDSRQLVSASQDGRLIIWNGWTANKVQAIPLRSSWVMTCAHEQTTDGMVACGGLDNICSIYKVGGEQAISLAEAFRELQAHDGYLSCCRFNGPGEILTASGDSTCIQWDVETGAKKACFLDHNGDVMSLAINPHSPHLFSSGSVDASVKVWDTRVGQSLLSFSGHESDVNSVSYFPDGNAIGSGSDDSSCKLFDLRACREISSYTNDSIVCGVTTLDFSLSGRIMFAGYDDSSCLGWDVTMKDRPLILNDLHEKRVSCLQVNPEGSALCTGSWDELLRIAA